MGALRYNKMIEETEEYQDKLAKEAQELVDETFPNLWKGVKEDMKDRSKKELAERMYLFGIMTHMRIIDIADFNALNKIYKRRYYDTSFDYDKDGKVGPGDYQMLIYAYGQRIIDISNPVIIQPHTPL